MRIEETVHDSWMILDIADDVTIDVEFGPLVDTIRSLLMKGTVKIALRFTTGSYLSTRAISPLVRCHSLMRDAGGVIALLGPNENIVDTMEQVGLDAFIPMYRSEKDLT
ncbi:MAG: STAS domain-containing protein [Chitinivibrionales bacterium]|nr:STAS domain-containing protein [Chitinivibrionales bacterium]MBD3396246.1 STAS domain-containing protein [Chitinivibrionales bacterium]